MRLYSTCGDFYIWFCWIWLFCKLYYCDLWLYRCLSLYGHFCIIAWDLLFSSKLVCLIIGVAMISFLESMSFFKSSIFCCVLVLWQHSTFATALLNFSKYDSNFSCIAVSLFSKWRVGSVSNCSKVSVCCCAEDLGICLTFCNKGVSDWIGNWGVSFGVLGVSVWTESSSFLSDLVPGVIYKYFLSY